MDTKGSGIRGYEDWEKLPATPGRVGEYLDRRYGIPREDADELATRDFEHIVEKAVRNGLPTYQPGDAIGERIGARFKPSQS